MKETIKKSLVGGLVFSITVLTFFIVYAAIDSIWTTPSTLEVSSGSPLTATSWNKLLSNFNYLDSKTVKQDSTVITVNGSNVGVGTINPTTPLYVSGATTVSSLTANNSCASTPAANTLCKENIIKAWVNFDGTNGTIRSSFNVSSVTRTSVGNYTINWARPFADTNYAVVLTVGGWASNQSWGDLKYGTNPYTTTSVKIEAVNPGATAAVDPPYISVIAVGNQ